MVNTDLVQKVLYLHPKLSMEMVNDRHTKYAMSWRHSTKDYKFCPFSGSTPLLLSSIVFPLESLHRLYMYHFQLQKVKIVKIKVTVKCVGLE